MKKAIWIALVSIAMIACGEKPVATKNAATAPASVTPGPAQAAAPMGGSRPVPSKEKQFEGIVVEAIDASGFTYLRVKTAKNDDQWVVTTPVQVATGAKVTIEPSMTAERFESKSLKRTFDRVTFGRVVSGATPVATAANGAPMISSARIPSGHPAIGGGAAPHAMSENVELGPIHVAKAEGANGKLVAEIWASKASLADAEVAVRGKVVKFHAGIMGRNWVHLRDGSGSREKGDDDITVTTQETVKAGDVVLVHGVVRVEKDFGAGYRYAVILEEGKIAK